MPSSAWKKKILSIKLTKFKKTPIYWSTPSSQKNTYNIHVNYKYTSIAIGNPVTASLCVPDTGNTAPVSGCIVTASMGAYNIQIH